MEFLSDTFPHLVHVSMLADESCVLDWKFFLSLGSSHPRTCAAFLLTLVNIEFVLGMRTEIATIDNFSRTLQSPITSHGYGDWLNL